MTTLSFSSLEQNEKFIKSKLHLIYSQVVNIQGHNWLKGQRDKSVKRNKANMNEMNYDLKEMNEAEYGLKKMNEIDNGLKEMII